MTRDYKETILERVKKDPEFALATLKELLKEEERDQFETDERDLVEIFWDSKEPLLNVSPYRFRITIRADYEGNWIAIEEYINGKWMCFLQNSCLNFQNTYMEIALLNSSGYDGN